MNKEDLIKHHSYLDKMNQEVIGFDYDYNKGKNQKIRDKGQRYLSSEISRFDSYIRGNTDLFNIVISTNNETTNETQAAINYQEFISLRYFPRDLYRLVKKLEEMIEDFSN